MYCFDDTTKASYITYAHLCLWDDADTSPPGPRVYYLGYPLYLSPIETEILEALVRHTAAYRTTHPAATVSGGAFLPVETLSALAAGHGDPADPPALPSEDAIPPAQVAVYVARINRKAQVIGGRKLILAHKGRGYRLNPYM